MCITNSLKVRQLFVIWEKIFSTAYVYGRILALGKNIAVLVVLLL